MEYEELQEKNERRDWDYRLKDLNEACWKRSWACKNGRPPNTTNS